ncbi:bifunctional demethylmenaquinone methyltransferase/2-methoxy-6-polyprenyl-1,4-benzoquinol methylase UbiE [Gloeocapsa sp. PCC 73106]|uniref:bifunctional demethylmenaquinone methyltransferase/2-methoxy-6-polyprenyl-1,4-benzoquinol methylase UbiE n=1 Tax=Gloeocapsa sp. PCC 73106 TaxID=102232 RepID=UPI0002ABB6F3|nr:bifunctional demethylmenaquinone methyltransferase/2-methoxy-6-polyprenyl-1,4-benzoquinol methylase UbiE [Gloeocapsa sp. PCC 73106]ELR96570.1 ubiquinone/menaquinone biosynthesis methyltransferase [Gloeocapsa sp. PCC 73106]
MKKDEIQALFNRIAPVYDQLNQNLSLGQHKIWKRMAVKWSEANTGDTALDLCCGSGDLAHLLAKQVGITGKVYGVDFAQAQLAIAKAKAQKILPLHHFGWIEADVLHLPFADNYFNCATMGYGLRNVVDISQCLSELYRVLQPEAKAAILDFHRPYDNFWRNFQQFYLDYLVVPLAQSQGLKEEYAYISPSLDRFPQGKEQIALAKSLKFREAIHYPLVGGTMGVLVLTK